MITLGSVKITSRLQVALELKLADLWVGAFTRLELQKFDLWICVLPVLPIHISWDLS